VQRPDQDPGALAWFLAFISLLLPWAAGMVGLVGLWRIANTERGGWWYLAAAGAMLLADGLIDFVWAHRAAVATDQPDLNRRPAQLVGRVVAIEEPIVHGRGKVRIGDTLWEVEGPDVPAGTEMRVTASKGAVLRVERS
jgi:membrane protein implicated in regulation of membrane protease activity